MRQMSERETLVRNARRTLADLVGPHVWQWQIERVKMECSHVWKNLQDNLADDERNAIAILASEYEWSERRALERRQG